MALATLLAVPSSVSAATNLPLFDANFAIVPEACRACPCGIGGVLQLIQNLMNAAISISVLAVVITIAYGGALLLTSATNAEAKSKAKSVIANAVIGLVIVLAGWLIVDFVMKALYNPDVGPSSDNSFGPWNEILTGGPICITATNQKPLFSHIFDVNPPTQNPGDGANGGTTGDGTEGVPTPSTRGVCTPSGLQSAGWPANLATKMSCVTKYENASCNASAPSGTDIGADGKSVSIGLFQVNISAHDMNYPACIKLNGGQPLNCTQAFSGGAYTSKNHATRVKDARLYQTCRSAASNPACNTAAAIEIYNKQGIGAWGTRAQNACRSL